VDTNNSGSQKLTCECGECNRPLDLSLTEYIYLSEAYNNSLKEDTYVFHPSCINILRRDKLIHKDKTYKIIRRLKQNG
jgi:hypothetical protein